MRLSHTRKVFVLSMLLIVTALLGQAAAAQTSGPQVAASTVPAVPVTSAGLASPAAPKATAAKPRPKASSKRTESAVVNKRRGKSRSGRESPRTGPAGSLLTTGSTGVALTFDDGPDPQYTPVLLKMLAKQRVKATFCVVGQQAKRHPDLIRKIVAAGHSLCNHSWDHDLKLGKKPVAKIQADLHRTNAAIRAAAPKAKIRYMRAPGGNFTPALVSTARQMGMHSIYWKVDPRDWEHSKKESHADHRNKIIRVVQKRTRPGAIILSHDYAQPDTIDAYRTLLPWLKKRYRLIALT